MIKLKHIVENILMEDEWGTHDTIKKDTTPRSVEVPEAEILSVLKKRIKYFKYLNDGGYAIYRGNAHISPYKSYRVSPSTHNRMSRNTSNYYTMIVDNLDNWNSYPKRSKSIICTTDAEYAQQFGDDASHIVVPVKNAKFGVCPSLDMWGSFMETVGRLPEFNDHIRWIAEILNRFDSWKGTFNLDTGGWEDYMKFFAAVDIAKANTQVKEILKYEFSVYENWFTTYLEDPKYTFYQTLYNLFDPAVNGFELITNFNTQYTKLEGLRPAPEVWTDSDCYLISPITLEVFGKQQGWSER